MATNLLGKRTTMVQGSLSPHHRSHEALASPGRSVKRQKVTRACDNCKSKKKRCTGELPCTVCVANRSKCTYLASYTRGRLVQPMTAGHVEHDIEIGHPKDTVTATNGAQSTEPPSRATSLEAETSTNSAGQYLGPTSPYTFLRRALKRFEDDGANLAIPGGEAEVPGQSESIFAFGDRQAVSVDVEGFQLPSRPATAQLLSRYFELGMPTYRFLHQQTVAYWLDIYHQQEESGPNHISLSSSRQAVIFMVLATSRLLNVDESNEWLSPDEQSYRESEKLFRIGHDKLKREHGRARLESVQARLAEVLYLLHTSRPNQAWYSFGVAAQLAFALGLHRASTVGSSQQDVITTECRKRTFWATSTLDTYLSIILGRPAIIHLDDVDQEFPNPIEDEDLISEGITSASPGRDLVVKASIMHAQIARIVKKTARKQYSVARKCTKQRLEDATKLNAETATWHASLPVVLSGMIHPSSLIPIFRRQISVLQLAHGHAQMLINRPSLLMDTDQDALKQSQVEVCLSAANATLRTVLSAGIGQRLFQAFWFTQFVCFNALSIIYVWFILRKHGKLPASTTVPEEEMAQLAETAQQRLDDASEANAPSLRYSIVLQELRQEVQRLNNRAGLQLPPVIGPLDVPPNESTAFATSSSTAGPNRAPDALDSANPFLEPFTSDFPLDTGLWLSLDSFPFSGFGPIECDFMT